MDVFIVAIESHGNNNSSTKSEAPTTSTISNNNSSNTSNNNNTSNDIVLLKQMVTQANSLVQSKEYRKALSLFEQLLVLGIDPIGCTFNIGSIYLEAGQYNKAMPYLLKAFESNRDVLILNKYVVL